MISNATYPGPPTAIQLQTSSVLLQDSTERQLTMEATTLKYMQRVRPTVTLHHTEIMTCRHRADIYEAKVFMTFGPRSAQTITTSTNTHLSLVHNRTKLKNSGLSQPRFALFDSYIIYIIFSFNKEPVCYNQLRR